jgi:hypothetical protein
MSSRNQKIVSGIFMLFVLAVNIALTYYSFNVQTSLSNLSDKTNLSYVNAFNSWDISLIAINILILIVSIIGVIVSPYIIVVFLFLYLLVIMAFFVYTSIALSALLETSDYELYKTGCTSAEGKNTINCDKIVSNFQNGLTSTITIMVLSGITILLIILFLYFMIKSLSKSGGLEREIDTLFNSPSRTVFDSDGRSAFGGYSPFPYRTDRPYGPYGEYKITPELSKFMTAYAAKESRSPLSPQRYQPQTPTSLYNQPQPQYSFLQPPTQQTPTSLYNQTPTSFIQPSFSFFQPPTTPTTPFVPRKRQQQ